MYECDRVIIYDGICGLCHGWVRFVIRHDAHAVFRFASFQSATGQSLLKQNHLSLENLETLVYIESGKVYVRSEAFLRIVARLAFPARLLYGFWLVPARLRDRLYARIAARRYQWFGTQMECSLTGDSIRDRFI